MPEETPKRSEEKADESKTIWEWLKNNKLYSTTEVGVLRYIGSAQYFLEYIMWYILLIAFSILCGYHMWELYLSTKDSIVTNQRIEVSKLSDFENVT